MLIDKGVFGGKKPDEPSIGWVGFCHWNRTCRQSVGLVFAIGIVHVVRRFYGFCHSWAAFMRSCAFPMEVSFYTAGATLTCPSFHFFAFLAAFSRLPRCFLSLSSLLFVAFLAAFCLFPRYVTAPNVFSNSIVTCL